MDPVCTCGLGVAKVCTFIRYGGRLWYEFEDVKRLLPAGVTTCFRCHKVLQGVRYEPEGDTWP